jgi:hypothetical protein
MAQNGRYIRATKNLIFILVLVLFSSPPNSLSCFFPISPFHGTFRFLANSSFETYTAWASGYGPMMYGKFFRKKHILPPRFAQVCGELRAKISMLSCLSIVQCTSISLAEVSRSFSTFACAGIYTYS